MKDKSASLFAGCRIIIINSTKTATKVITNATVTNASAKRTSCPFIMVAQKRPPKIPTIIIQILIKSSFIPLGVLQKSSMLQFTNDDVVSDGYLLLCILKISLKLLNNDFSIPSISFLILMSGYNESGFGSYLQKKTAISNSFTSKVLYQQFT